MLIIFDLDDTLIQTTKQITPFKLELLSEVFKNHPNLENQNIDFSMLQRLNLASLGSLEAIFEFSQVLGLPEEFILKIVNDFKLKNELPEVVLCNLGARESIEELCKEHVITIVTRGLFSFQKKKIDQADLPLDKIKKWLCVEKGSKLKAYSELQKEEGFLSEDVVVIGDRVDLDLLPAKQLGFYTIHLPSSRSLGSILEKEEIVDYQICSLNELSDMINDIKLKNFLRKI